MTEEQVKPEGVDSSAPDQTQIGATENPMEATETIRMKPRKAPTQDPTKHGLPPLAPVNADAAKVAQPAPESAGKPNPLLEGRTTLKLKPLGKNSASTPAAPATTESLTVTDPNQGPSATNTLRPVDQTQTTPIPKRLGTVPPPQSDSAAETVDLPMPTESGSGTPVPLGEGRTTLKLKPLSSVRSADLSTVNEMPSMTASASSAVPGAKQTIKLRPSATSGGVAPSETGIAIKPASAQTIKLTPSASSGQNARQTIKLVPSGSASSTPSEAPGVSSGAPTMKVDSSAPSAAPTLKLTPPNATAPGAPTLNLTTPSSPTLNLSSEATTSPSAPTMKKTLTLTRPGGSQEQQGGSRAERRVDALKKKAAEAAKAEPGGLFLSFSIVALLILLFTIMITAIQYYNMYEGTDVEIPGIKRVSAPRPGAGK